MANFMRFDFARAVWTNSTDGGQTFSDAGWCLLSGTLANRPAAGVADRLYFATDTQELYHDTGTSWLLIATKNMLTNSNLNSNGGTILETANLNSNGGTILETASIGKAIGDLPQYEDDGAGNAVVNHPNMPTVAGDPVVESGSNADGDWVRYSDGTQMCWGQQAVAQTSDLDTGVAYPVNGATGIWFATGFTFPATFNASPLVFETVHDDSRGRGEAILSLLPLNVTTTGFTWNAADISGASDIESIGYMAIGRWK